MLVIQLALASAIAVGFAVTMSVSDASDLRWHRDVGFRPVRRLVLFDVVSSLIGLAILSTSSNLAWQAATASTIVALQGRHALGTLITYHALGTLITNAVSAGVAPWLSVKSRIGVPAVKRLSELRERLLTHAGRESARHETRVQYAKLPLVRALHRRGDLSKMVVSWCANSKLDKKTRARLIANAQVGDDDSLLTFMGELSSPKVGGRRFLDDLVSEARNTGLSAEEA